MARRHAFEHPGHREEKRSTDSDSSSRVEIIVLRGAAYKLPSAFPIASWARSRAISAAPIAPIRWAVSGRIASTLQIFSNARSTASDLNAPPCTTILGPSESILSAPMMRNRAFFTTEYAIPAAKSLTLAPIFWACLTRDDMNTVHFVPRSTGCSEVSAASLNAWGLKRSECAVPSMNDPQPLEHASLRMAFATMPFLIQSAFMSCPPMSSTNVASGTSSIAARACAVVSTMPESMPSAAHSRSSPYPVAVACATQAVVLSVP